MKHLLVAFFLTVAISSSRADLFINEIDYDNSGTDSNEWVEITGTAGQSLNGYELVMVNQLGTTYATFDLTPASFTFSDETGSGWGFFVIGIVYPGYSVTADFTPGTWTANEIQNGTNDSMQLRLTAGPVNVHFVDYDGNNLNTTDDQFTALTDSTTDLQTTLYLTGSGDGFSDFSFANTSGNGTPGAINNGQTLTAIPEPASMLLIGTGAGILGLWRRRRAVA